MRYSSIVVTLGTLALMAQAGCSKSGEANTTGGRDSGAKGAGAPAAGAKGGPGGRGGISAIVLGPTDVTTVRAGVIEASIPISGDLKPIEVIAVRSRVEGNVLQVYARVGDRVASGQLLARFENAVQEGDRASATADYEAAKADVANAQWNADQSSELFKAGAIPERDLRNAQQTLAASKARLAATEARVRASNQNARDTRILSPTSGLVSQRTVEAGEHVTRGATIFIVVRNDVLELEASVPARQANDLKVGQAVRFATSGRQLEGRVARISPTINLANRSITVFVQVPNRDGSLKGNSFATGRIIGQAIPNAVLIPTPAVRQSVQGGEKAFVYRIEGGKVEHQDVQVGIVDEALGVSQVIDGLTPGDVIVVGNVGALGRGMDVRVVSAEDARRGGGAPGAGGAAGAPPGGGGAAAGPPAGRDSTRGAPRPDSLSPR